MSFELATSRLASEEYIHSSLRTVEEVGVHVKYNPINTCVKIIDMQLSVKLLDFG